MTESLDPPIYVTEKTVCCDGACDSSPENGHPRVYLPIKDQRVECPYCGRVFMYKET